MRLRRGDSGMVGFTAMVPLVLATIVLVWEAFLIGMSMTYASHAANEGARIAAVGGDQRKVEEAAVKRISGAWADKDNIEVVYPGGRICNAELVPKIHPDCGFVRVDIKPPLLFKGMMLPTTVSARTWISYEGTK